MSLAAWKQFICRACGLIYDEEKGDPDSGLPAGTRFEDVPEDWVCPLCGVVKADFEPYEQPVLSESRASRQVAAARGTGVVIVGAGHSGWAVAEALRALDLEVQITIVSACQGDRYLKPELSIAMSRGATRETLVRESASAAAQRLGVRLWPETFVVGLSPTLHQLRTTRGTLHFSHLVLAQGARPATPAALPASLCWRINDLAGWSGLHRKLSHGRRHVAIIGAGMVGCELADDFVRSGHQVTLMDIQAEPLAAWLPEVAARRLRAGLECSGVRFIGSVKVSGVTCDRSGTKTIMTDCGQAIQADEIVAATGLVTESRLADRASLTFDRGIVVDPVSLRTSAANVYALGDCVSIHGAPCRFIEPISKQASAIAHEILGQPHSGYAHSQPVIRLKTKSLPILLHGVPRQDGIWEVVENRTDFLVMRQVFDHERVATLEVGQDHRHAA